MNTQLPAEDIIKKIYEQVKQVPGQQDNPEKLTEIGGQLVVLNWALGEWLTKFENEEREAKTELDLEEANLLEEYTNKTDPVTDKPFAVNKAEFKAKIKLGSKRREYNQVVNMVSKCKIHRNDTSKVVEMLRTRVSLIKEAVERGVPA